MDFKDFPEPHPEHEHAAKDFFRDLESASQALYSYDRGELGYAVDEAARRIVHLEKELAELKSSQKA